MQAVLQIFNQSKTIKLVKLKNTIYTMVYSDKKKVLLPSPHASQCIFPFNYIQITNICAKLNYVVWKKYCANSVMFANIMRINRQITQICNDFESKKYLLYHGMQIEQSRERDDKRKSPQSTLKMRENELIKLLCQFIIYERSLSEFGKALAQLQNRTIFAFNSAIVKHIVRIQNYYRTETKTESHDLITLKNSGKYF